MPVQRIDNIALHILQWVLNHDDIAIKVRLRTEYHVDIVARVIDCPTARRQNGCAAWILEVNAMMHGSTATIRRAVGVVPRPVIDIVLTDRTLKNEMIIHDTLSRHRGPRDGIAAKRTGDIGIDGRHCRTWRRGEGNGWVTRVGRDWRGWTACVLHCHSGNG